MHINDSNLTIKVTDLEKSISFYESIGFLLKAKWGNHYAQLSANGLMIGLHPATENEIPGNSGNVSIGFTTDDFDNIKKKLSQSSIDATERKEEGGEFLHFKDPDGTSLYFIQPNW